MKWIHTVPIWVWWVFGIGVAVGMVVFFGTAALEAWVDVKNSPREKMGWCFRHGFFRAEHQLDMALTKVCPRCYYNSLKQAGEIR